MFSRIEKEYQDALTAYTEALQIAEEIRDTAFTIVCIRNIAHFYKQRNQLKEAEEILQKAIDLSEKMHTPNPVALRSLNMVMGGIKYDANDLVAALDYYQNALELAEKNTVNQLFALVNVAKVYKEMGQYEQMMSFLGLSQQINQTVQSKKIQLVYSHQLADYFLNTLEKTEEAKTYAMEGLKIARSEKDRGYEMDFLKILVEVYRQSQNYEMALSYMDTFSQTRKEIWENNQEDLILEMQAKYEAKEKATQIELLQQQQIAQQAQIRQNQIIAGLVACSALLLLLGAWGIYRYRVGVYELKMQLAQKSEELSKQELQNVQNDLKIKVMQSGLEGQLLERKRIARDLHDSLGGLLAGIKLKALNVKQSQQLPPIVDAIDKACNEVRFISHYLHPPEFKDRSFFLILNQLINDFNNRKETEVVLDINTPELLEHFSIEQKMEIYRILQELVYNAFRHGQAATINVSLLFHEDYLNIMVEDDGKGFDVKKAKNGLGLKSIADRVEKLNASWDLDSTPGYGTVAQVNIPI